MCYSFGLRCSLDAGRKLQKDDAPPLPPVSYEAPRPPVVPSYEAPVPPPSYEQVAPPPFAPARRVGDSQAYASALDGYDLSDEPGARARDEDSDALALGATPLAPLGSSHTRRDSFYD